MIAPKVLSQADVSARLRAKGFRDTSEVVEVKGGEYAVWVTEWGEVLMVPQDGPDKVCAEFILLERMQKVLATKPPARRKK